MKVLFIQKMAGIAGSEMYFMNILPELNRRGIQAEFGCIQHPRDTEKSKKFLQHLKVAGVPYFVIKSRYPVSISLLLQLKKIIKKNKYDIVQTNLIHADLWGAILRSFTRLPFKLISAKHGYDENFQRKYGFDHTHLTKNLFYRISKYANGKMDFNISVSKGLGDLLVKGKLLNPQKLAIIQLGFNFPDFATNNGGHSDYRFGSPQLLIIGRLIPVKQHHLVIDFLPGLKKKYPGLKLVLVGRGELEASLKETVKEKGLGDTVIFKGFQSNIHDYIAASDLMLVPSSAEGFGVVILEAWHHKKPVIAFDVPAPNEIIQDGEDGYLIKTFDTRDMCQKIGSLLENDELRNRMGQHGYEKLQHQFSLAVMTDKTISLYKKVITANESS